MDQLELCWSKGDVEGMARSAWFLHKYLFPYMKVKPGRPKGTGKLSLAEKEEIKGAYKNGEPVKKLKKKYGVSHQTIYGLLKNKRGRGPNKRGKHER